ncbi:hypothetical protein IAU60_002278 [Kwoniella sp. DSM 27419]
MCDIPTQAATLERLLAKITLDDRRPVSSPTLIPAHTSPTGPAREPWPGHRAFQDASTRAVEDCRLVRNRLPAWRKEQAALSVHKEIGSRDFSRGDANREIDRSPSHVNMTSRSAILSLTARESGGSPISSRIPTGLRAELCDKAERTGDALGKIGHPEAGTSSSAPVLTAYERFCQAVTQDKRIRRILEPVHDSKLDQSTRSALRNILGWIVEGV